MALAFVTFTTVEGDLIDINPSETNIDACRLVDTTQVPTGVGPVTAVSVRGVVHRVRGALATVIAALLAGATGGIVVDSGLWAPTITNVIKLSAGPTFLTAGWRRIGTRVSLDLNFFCTANVAGPGDIASFRMTMPPGMTRNTGVEPVNVGTGVGGGTGTIVFSVLSLHGGTNTLDLVPPAASAAVTSVSASIVISIL